MEIQELNTTENLLQNQARRNVKLDTKFDFDDILLQPTSITHINSRYSDIQLNKFLPVMAAPMDTVVSLDNYKLFLEHGIEVCMPRGEDMSKVDDERVFLSYSLAEFEAMLDEFESIGKPLPKRICIDMANGHMERLHQTIRRARSLVGDSIEIMTGNVGSPEGFIELAQAGVDYVRCGIGFGGGCLTSQQTGVGYAMASLVKECRDAKVEHNLSAKIIADGGMKDYADIIKSLALGADIVILGSVLNKALESCAPTYMENKKHESWTEPGEQIDQYDEKYEDLFKSGVQLYKKFRGMSTKGVQKKWGNDKVRTSEGVVRLNPVMYTLSGWRENLEAYLRSAMSYCGASRIEEFIGIPSYTFISENTLKRFRK